MTQRAQEVSVEIQRDFPTVVRLPVDDNLIRMTARAELAVALLQDPNHHMLDTFRRKGRPSNIRVQEPDAVGCLDSDCILPLMRRLLRSGKCPKAGCLTSGDDLIYRHEQKIVDTMLTCDLVHAASGLADQILLVSNDDDFLPPLRTLLARGTRVIRLHPKFSSRHNPTVVGVHRLIEMEL
jgi:uncharacterized LabA/DUF88 family protein